MEDGSDGFESASPNCSKHPANTQEIQFQLEHNAFSIRRRARGTGGDSCHLQVCGHAGSRSAGNPIFHQTCEASDPHSFRLGPDDCAATFFDAVSYVKCDEFHSASFEYVSIASEPIGPYWECNFKRPAYINPVALNG